MSMRVPLATYRIQFNQAFRFVDARDLVPYLNDLGISDLYSSPWFKARRGSSHGYDIADPSRINSELGTEEEVDELARKLRRYDMGLLLDLVPNHMAASAENPWWMDVLENGERSEYARFFDIDWHPAMGKASFLTEGRVLLPVLGDLYGNVLENQELTLKIDDTGLFVRYYDTKLPLDPRTWGPVLEESLRQAPESTEIRDILKGLPDLAPREIKRRMWQAYHGSAEVRSAVDEARCRAHPSGSQAL
ncbi:MAG: alpha-amylase family glycosyl hydrolase, partial [Acidobacteria bacterium]|nr:alpha-amylase family glycosyl hydrolase [Acidobacteriota bacterium]